MSSWFGGQARSAWRLGSGEGVTGCWVKDRDTETHSLQLGSVRHTLAPEHYLDNWIHLLVNV